ncbi:MAG: prepilin peptidase [Oscillospiraceae bacterium]
MQNILKNKKLVFSALAAIACVAIAIRQFEVMSLFNIAKLATGLVMMTLAAYTDSESKIITNKLVLAMLGFWAAFMAVGLFLGNMQAAINAVLASLAGGLFALVVFGITYIASKRQLGGGDVKLATVMGLFLTSERIAGALIYGLILCALYSGVMLFLKKLGKKDAVALAPFLAVGYFISLMFVF